MFFVKLQARAELCVFLIENLRNANLIPPDHRVIRTCGWEESSYKDRCYQRAGFGGRQEVCSCSTDFCNSAPAIALPSLLAVVLFTMLRTLFF
ncbi:hypothetical protein B566_EDAN004893 [Ephemera danica]|nr:hypothetical protein B566_EDAN004893 [Ephemera danica]